MFLLACLCNKLIGKLVSVYLNIGLIYVFLNLDNTIQD